MINNVIFYNHFHNGDIFFSKGYVRHMMSLFHDKNIFYAHVNDPKICKDLNATHIDIRTQPIPPLQNKITILDDNLYINTWIGNYLNDLTGCNWDSLHKMYRKIYYALRTTLGMEFPINKMDYYAPFIDYSHYDIPTDFVCDYDNTIIFSNGPVLSGQSNLGSTEGIIRSILSNFPEKKLVLTHRSGVSHDNIIYTDEIIRTTGSDLNEISWVSNKCKYVIGRQSGPFSFMQTNENTNDENKIMIGFSNDVFLDWLYGVETACTYSNIIEKDENDVIRQVVALIEDGEKNV
jgi:hypothetical protein